MKLVDQKCDKRNNGDDGNGGDPTGAEPIFFLAFIEDDLQRGDPHGKQADAPVIDFLRSAADVRGSKIKSDVITMEAMPMGTLM